MYDVEGNPLFETTDEENSSEGEENSTEETTSNLFFGPERTVWPTPSQGALDS